MIDFEIKAPGVANYSVWLFNAFSFQGQEEKVMW